MRVAIFTDNDFDKVNGVTTALGAVLRHAPADIAPRIYTASTLGVDRPDYLSIAAPGVPIPFYAEMKMYWPSWRRFARRVREDGIRVLHLTTPGPLGLAALRVARQTGLPLVGSFHTHLEAYTATLSGSHRLGRWMSLYLRWMYNHCARVLAPSEDTRALLISRGTPADRLAIWPRGVDTELFQPSRRSASWRREWRVAEDRPALLYVGRLSREKGLLRLPLLSAALHRRGIDHRLVFAGDGPVRRELSDACPDAVFLGSLDRGAVATAFASSDVFVFPSTTDTAGNVVLEAQASGVPVVVSATGGPKENLLPGQTGLVCDDDLVTWMDALSWLTGSRETRRDMGEAARGYALTRRWDLALAPLYDAYRAVSRGASGQRLVEAA